jgi:type II secretory pathway component GspD/PulD (secretin)
MKLNCDGRDRRKMKIVTGVVAITLAVTFSGQRTLAQTVPAGPQVERLSVQTFYLTNVYQTSDATELTTALRNLLDKNDKIYLVPSQNAILVQGPPDQLVLARKLLDDLDRPKKTYRLTYTITETDGGKRIGNQHFGMVVVAGQRTVLKQGSKIPLLTGPYNNTSSQAEPQVTYIDVGLNFDATLDEFANGVRLRTKIDQSSVAEEKSGVGPQDPVVRQTSLEGTSFLTPGKPLVLGSLDVPGSTRHQEVEVVMEAVR